MLARLLDWNNWWLNARAPHFRCLHGRWTLSAVQVSRFKVHAQGMRTEGAWPQGGQFEFLILCKKLTVCCHIHQQEHVFSPQQTLLQSDRWCTLRQRQYDRRRRGKIHWRLWPCHCGMKPSPNHSVLAFFTKERLRWNWFPNLKLNFAFSRHFLPLCNSTFSTVWFMKGKIKTL